MSTEVAKEILNQLGGNRFLAMTGASKMVGGSNYLMFSIPSRKVNKVKITLNSLDLYDIEFYKIRKLQVIAVATVSGVYFDQLQEIFTEKTGLYTSL